eukprot:TRINITY_DN1376_c0_g4_i1.p1 TRINITY_DN1376_c0_g4~~TRINITY_DN1376_c0_g4_i1.p1  ORF type:complete len:426 (-),score=27.65 TRINITY_DN1376_c0_g4_i1:182-1459(-)
MNQETRETGITSMLSDKGAVFKQPDLLSSADSQPGPKFSLHSDSNESLPSSPSQAHKSTSPSTLNAMSGDQITELPLCSGHKITLPLCRNVREDESLKSLEAEKGWRRLLKNGKGRAEIANGNNKAMKVIGRKGKCANVWLKGKLMNPRCHYCRTRDKRANHLLCAHNPKCKVNFCFPCLRKQFDLDPERPEFSSWICLVCANECICIRCQRKEKEKALKAEERSKKKHEQKNTKTFNISELGKKRHCQRKGNNSDYLSLFNRITGYNFAEAGRASEVVISQKEGDKHCNYSNSTAALNGLIKLEKSEEQKHEIFTANAPEGPAGPQCTIPLPCDPNGIFFSFPLVDQQQPYSAISYPKRQYGNSYQLQSGCTRRFSTAAPAHTRSEACPQTGAVTEDSAYKNLGYVTVPGFGAADFGYGSCFIP